MTTALNNLVARSLMYNSRMAGAFERVPEKRQLVAGRDGLSAVSRGLVTEYADRLSHEDRKWQRALTRAGIDPRTVVPLNRWD